MDTTKIYISRDDVFADERRCGNIRKISKSTKKNFQPIGQIHPDSTFDLRTQSTTLTFRTESCICCNNTQDIHDTHKTNSIDDSHKKIKRRPANYRSTQEDVKKKNNS